MVFKTYNVCGKSSATLSDLQSLEAIGGFDVGCNRYVFRTPALNALNAFKAFRSEVGRFKTGKGRGPLLHVFSNGTVTFAGAKSVAQAEAALVALFRAVRGASSASPT